MDAFQEVIDNCGLQDLGYSGSCFTWQRGKQRSTLVRERLDRVLATTSWCSLFPEASVRIFRIHRLDHAPMLLSYEGKHTHYKSRNSFKFEPWWFSSDECEHVVKDGWEYNITSSPTRKVDNCA